MVGASSSTSVAVALPAPEAPATPSSNADQRWLVWAFVGITWAGLACAPLAYGHTNDEHLCIVDVDKDAITLTPRSYVLGAVNDGAPKIGQHFVVTGAAAAFLAAIVDPCSRLCWHRPMHIWTALCCGILVIGSALQLVRPWIAAACANVGADFAVWESALAAATATTWVTWTCTLCWITVLRLRLVTKKWASVASALLRGVVVAALVGIPARQVHRAGPVLSPTLVLVAAVVTTVATICGLLLFGVFHGVALYALGSAAQIAEEEARASSDGQAAAMSAARWAFASTYLAAGAAITTAAVLCSALISNLFPGVATSGLFEAAVAFDAVANAACALFLSGIIGGSRVADNDLATVGLLVHDRWKRRILQEVRNAGLPATGPGMVLAAICDGESPEVILANAVARFRCISWEVLSTMPEVITGGGPLDVVGSGSQELYQSTEPCRLACCDAFLSHSWHDNGELKWTALSSWVEDFKNAYQRSPRLWIDKFCIDQKNIKADLRGLPIFLAGCNDLLVLSGSTYTSRLWCCGELFIYVNMLDEDDSRGLPAVIMLGADSDEHERVRQSWENFDASTCKCFDKNDKERILAVIKCYPGGIQGFNAHVRVLLGALLPPGAQGVRGRGGDASDRTTAGSARFSDEVTAVTSIFSTVSRQSRLVATSATASACSSAPSVMSRQSSERSLVFSSIPGCVDNRSFS